MFAKLHRHQHQHQHQPQEQHYQSFHHQHPLHHLDQQISEEEEESRSSGGGGGGARSISNKKPKPNPDSNEIGGGSGGGGEDGTIEVAKRPRGRPPGSKNKPKPPLIITRETNECAMRPLFLELPTGLDLIDAIARFTHRRNIGLTVLTASGAVTNVSFRQPSVNSTTTTSEATVPGSIVTFHGRFEILSISATFLPPSLPILTTPSSSSSSSSPTILPSSFMISLVGPQGQIIGGSVANSLITAGVVFVMAASFENPSYHRLPIEGEENHHHDMPNNSATSEETHAHHHHHRHQQQPLQQQQHHQDDDSNALVESCGMSMYHHVPHPDLLWAPTPRPPQPF